MEKNNRDTCLGGGAKSNSVRGGYYAPPYCVTPQRALHGRHGGVLVRRTVGAFLREPGAGRMAWMAMAPLNPPLSSQDAEMLDLVRVDKARRTIYSCSEKVCPRGALDACDVVTRDTNLARAK